MVDDCVRLLDITCMVYRNDPNFSSGVMSTMRNLVIAVPIYAVRIYRVILVYSFIV